MMKERFEAESNSNVLFVTAQCSNRCIMCCEPPKTENDLEFCLRRNVRLIETAPKDTREVCVTGGEPTISRGMFLELIRKISSSLPETSIHVLSNGRSFKDADFTRSTAETGGGRLIMGILTRTSMATMTSSPGQKAPGGTPCGGSTACRRTASPSSSAS